MLLRREATPERREVARRELSGLTVSLRRDLGRLLVADLWIPREKAKMTRIGGRCPVHRCLLDFDPWSPRAHRCPVCGETFTEEEHYRWWVMNYQLWLSERSVHAAALSLLTGDKDCRELAIRILEGYSDLYLHYPNRDNVLGPSRLFFSTYLESIWLLQVAVAGSLLGDDGDADSLVQLVTDRIIEPAVQLIAGYPEGLSNREAWNCAALAAGARMLGRDDEFEQRISGNNGLQSILNTALLADGSWYEGENYHLFAHRGLWYGVTMAESAGLQLSQVAGARFQRGFLTPFLTALPDLTFPARRDSQYAVSLQQWRMAESCELGLARRPDPDLASILGELYRPAVDVGPGPTGRAVSTAEAERNVPATALDRSSLGWKSLLCARPVLPAAERWTPRSVHLPAQGFSVLRRDAGQVYVALDWGLSGGGHGHPDRLNLWLVNGRDRILEDPGTRSYVDESLFWYRSTLAHNAPMVDGMSQPPVDGALIAWDERGAAGLVAATAQLPRAAVTRRVVLMPGYMVDRVDWEKAEPDDDEELTLDLPLHVPLVDDDDVEWTEEPGFPAMPGSGTEFVTKAWRTGRIRQLSTVGHSLPFRLFIGGDESEWWKLQARAGREASDAFYLARFTTRGARGTSVMVWSWSAAVASVEFGGQTAGVLLGNDEEHSHRLESDGRWSIQLRSGGARSSIDLMPETQAPGTSSGSRRVATEPRESAPRYLLAGDREVKLELGEAHYRKSESSWLEAGAPSAIWRVRSNPRDILMNVDVAKPVPTFAPRMETNALDNEHPDINSDGVQLYLDVPESGFLGSWILVPEVSGRSTGKGSVRVTPRTGHANGAQLLASWGKTANGYQIDVTISRSQLGAGNGSFFRSAVVVNEIVPDRERRRGQLAAVWPPAGGEFVYLRGDREDPVRWLGFVVTDE
ncbi:MAG: heparinase II/III domain-containing protein [Gemmatimonadota bacterium]